MPRSQRCITMVEASSTTRRRSACTTGGGPLCGCGLLPGLTQHRGYPVVRSRESLANTDRPHRHQSPPRPIQPNADPVHSFLGREHQYSSLVFTLW